MYGGAWLIGKNSGLRNRRKLKSFHCDRHAINPVVARRILAAPSLGCAGQQAANRLFNFSAPRRRWSQPNAAGFASA
jgi:hypothetical protein